MENGTVKWRISGNYHGYANGPTQNSYSSYSSLTYNSGSNPDGGGGGGSVTVGDLLDALLASSNESSLSPWMQNYLDGNDFTDCCPGENDLLKGVVNGAIGTLEDSFGLVGLGIKMIGGKEDLIPRLSTKDKTAELTGILLFAAMEPTPGGEISAGGKALKNLHKTSGWVKKSIFNSLDPVIQKKVIKAIDKGIVSPVNNSGIVKLTATEAKATGYAYKIKILGKGGDIRIYGNANAKGHIFFEKISGH
ncbi:hypothetical protein [Chryseobacterium indoltheticum]|nr:hypothetical protein [Chryseobacterium indoltheticum]